MGYGIALYRIKDVASALLAKQDPFSRCIERVADDYLSYNFSKEPYSDFWTLRSVLGCSTTNQTVLENMQKALDDMKKQGYTGHIPQGCDGWTSEPVELGMNVFMHHVQRLRTLFLDNPNCVITADIRFAFQLTEDELQSAKNEKPVPVVAKANIVTYYRHPIKGNFCVDNFAKAAEVYAICLLNGDERAEGWLNIAKMMPDAPPH